MNLENKQSRNKMGLLNHPILNFLTIKLRLKAKGVRNVSDENHLNS